MIPDIKYLVCLSDSEVDVVNETGNLSLNSDVPFNADNGGEPNGGGEPNRAITTNQQRKRWDLNYQEASIYLQEGSNNDKFSAHPKSQDALPAYLITHNKWFYILDLAAALLLMTLALVERPYVPPLHVHVGVSWVNEGKLIQFI